MFVESRSHEILLNPEITLNGYFVQSVKKCDIDNILKAYFEAYFPRAGVFSPSAPDMNIPFEQTQFFQPFGIDQFMQATHA